MKIEIVKDDVVFIPEHEKDLFYIGVISAKHPCSVRFTNNEVTGLGIKLVYLIQGLVE